MRQTRAAHASSPIRPLLRVASIAKIATDQPEIGPDRLGMLEHAVGRIGVGHNRGLRASKNSRLFGADGLASMPEILHVVEIDSSQDPAVAVKDVDGIKPPAKTDFEYDDIQRVARKDLPGCQRA